ncbi:MAG TPA: NAD(+) synthase [Lutibacter sp.]|nr:NAD(+) synthase [Lutibacter sp.]
MNTKKTTDFIVSWLSDYAKKANIKGFVLGISGGIDSAVTANLCARTAYPVLCVEMPIHQAENQVKRGKKLIQQLKNSFPKTQSEIVDLTATFETFKQVIPTTENEAKVNLSLANTRARLRMTTLFHLAGLHSYIVAGTGNKVEDFGVGFFTKYGDGGVDISPIADLMKSEVYQLAAYLNVPKSIQQAAPTDGLFGDNRTDEDQIGASYDELEWAMQQLDLGKKLADFSDRKKEVFEIYTRLHRANRHKMIPIPVCEIPEEIKN